MNKKTVTLFKRYANESGFHWKNYHKEYTALPWTKRHEYKQRLLRELSGETSENYQFIRGLGKKDIRIK